MKEKLKKVLTGPAAIKGYSSVACIALGLIIGLIVLLCMSPSDAFREFGTLITGGMFLSTSLTLKSFLNILLNTAPLICCGLCVLFAYKTGLFNIGAAGQYTIGAFGALTFAVHFHWHWILCLLVAALFGAIWAAIPGVLKVFCHVNEVISGIMLNWIGLFFTNWSFQTYLKDCLNKQEGYKTYAVSGISKLPTISIEGTNGLSIGIFIAIVLAIIVWLTLDKTTLGYQLKASGLNREATRYAGMNEKKNVIVTMAIAGALAGVGAGLYYLGRIEQWSGTLSTSLPGVPWNGIVVAFVAQLNPFGALIVSFIITVISQGAKSMTQTIFPAEMGDLITGIVVYLSGLVAFVMTVVAHFKEKKRMAQQKGKYPDMPTSLGAEKEGGKENA